MKRAVVIVTFFISQLFLQNALAGDFDWLGNLNIQANADLSGFQVNLATRFHIGDAEIRTVIRSTDRPADAYMILRLSELSHRPARDVIRIYRSDKKRGWGYMAKRLGIKPGSREFHELKERHEFKRGGTKRSSHSGKGKGREKHHGHGR